MSTYRENGSAHSDHFHYVGQIQKGMEINSFSTLFSLQIWPWWVMFSHS